MTDYHIKVLVLKIIDEIYTFKFKREPDNIIPGFTTHSKAPKNVCKDHKKRTINKPTG